MSTPIVYGGLGMSGKGLGTTGLGGPQPVQSFALAPMAKTKLAYVAHLYDHNLLFKRTLGAASLLTRPGLKLTQNGGYQPIVLELASSLPNLNLVIDPGFEQDNGLADVQNRWALGNPGEWALTSTPGDYMHGMRAVKCTRVGTAANSWNNCSSKVLIPVVPGQTYTGSVWSKQNAGTQGSHFKVSWWDYNKNALSNSQPMGSQNGIRPWTFYTGTFVAPINAYYAEVECMAGWWDGVTGTSAQTWYDDARLVVGTDSNDGIGPGDVIRISEDTQGIWPGAYDSFEIADPANSTIPLGWVHNDVGSGTSTLVASLPHSGANSVQLTNPSGGNYGGIYRRAGIALPSSGGILRLSIWGRSNSPGTTGGPFRITFANRGQFIDENGIASGQPSAQLGVIISDRNLSLGTSYAQYTDSIPVPAGFGWAFIELYDVAGGATINLDDVDVWLDSVQPTVIFSGNVESTPELIAPGQTSHEVEVVPWVVELGDGYFNQNYTVPTDVAQWVRDAVATTAHCSVSPISCPNTGIMAVYNFQQTNPLDVIHIARQVAGSNYWWFVDAQGVVWFQPTYTDASHPATITLRRGVDFNRRKASSSIQAMRNKIVVVGGTLPGDTSKLSATYDGLANQALYGLKAFNPTLSYPAITDQATLNAIAASLGSQYDRVLTTVEMTCPALGIRLSPARPGGLTVRYWEPMSETQKESATGSGTFSPTYVLQDIENDGPEQKLVFGDVPYADTDSAYEAARIAQRTSVIAAVTAVVPPLQPQPPPPQTVTFGFVNASSGIFAMGGGIVTIATATFTTARAGTIQVVGSVDARMEAWDNYVGTPRRSIRATLSGGIFTGAWQELPFGLTRATYDLSSAAGLALPQGTYTVTIDIDTQEFNQMHVYSGYVQVIWTG